MQKAHPGHKFSSKERTSDVLTEEQVDFESLLLSPLLIKGLTDSGFEKPSPIQLKAIPLGRCGLDLIAQAKSGTGKTCVFSVIALESINTESHATQVLILAPTREIAVQIKDVVSAIGCHIKGLSCQVFIGGLPLEEDKKALKGCHIAVGSPGRIKSLIESSNLRTDCIRMFILDEADKLLDGNFQEQINWIYSTLPANKQMMAFSATYPDYLANHLTRYMREPTFVRLNASDPTLQGIKQFYLVVPFHHLPHKVFQEKVDHLLKLLSKVNFHQCLLFSNYQIRAQNLSSTLCAKGWPATFIAGSQTQQKRLKAIEKLKEFKCRILISTDLTARGIDAENVNLVVNMDIPRDGETYLHRIGRAGRFGTKGIAVTFVAKGKEEKDLREIEKSIGIKMEALPDYIPKSLMTSDVSLSNGQGLPKKDTVEVNVIHKNSGREYTSDSEKLTSDVSLSNGQGLPKKDTVEFNVIHKNSGSEYTSDAEKLTNAEVQDIMDDSRDVHHVASSRQTVTDSTHNTSILTNTQYNEPKVQQRHDDITMELSGDYKIEEKCIVSSGSTNSNYNDNMTDQFTMQHKQSLPSVEEFDKDFEEYLALSANLENLCLQENSADNSVDINENIDNYSCDKQDTAVACDVSQDNSKTVDNNITESSNQDDGETCLRQDEDGTSSGDNDDDDDDDSDDSVDSTYAGNESHKIKHGNDSLCENVFISTEDNRESHEKEEFDTDDDDDDDDGFDGRDDDNEFGTDNKAVDDDGDDDHEFGTDDNDDGRDDDDGDGRDDHEFGTDDDNDDYVRDDNEFGTDDDGRDNDHENSDEKQGVTFSHCDNEYSIMSGKKYSENSMNSQINEDRNDAHHQITEQSNQATENCISFSNSIKYNDQNGLFTTSADAMPNQYQMIDDRNLASSESSACKTYHDHKYEAGILPQQHFKSVGFGNSVDHNSVPYHMYGSNGSNEEVIPKLLDYKLNSHQGAEYQVCNQREYTPCHDVQWSNTCLNAFHSINNTITQFARNNTRL